MSCRAREGGREGGGGTYGGTAHSGRRELMSGTCTGVPERGKEGGRTECLVELPVLYVCGTEIVLYCTVCTVMYGRRYVRWDWDVLHCM